MKIKRFFFLVRGDTTQQTVKNREESLEVSASTMHPQLMKYAKETDHKNMMARQLNRCDVYRLFPEFHHSFNNKQVISLIYYLTVLLIIFIVFKFLHELIVKD